MFNGGYITKVLNMDRANLVAYWPLYEKSGTNAKDLSDNVNDGTYSGVTLANEVSPQGTFAPDFDGVSDNVAISAIDGEVDTDEYTI